MFTSFTLFAQQTTSAYDYGKIAANVFVGVMLLIGVLWICKKLFGGKRDG